MPKPLRIAHRLLFIGLAIYWFAIAAGTHVPSRALGNMWLNDKVLHSSAFLGLSVLLSWCVMRQQPTAGRALLVLITALLYGVVDEMTQSWVPTRSADVYDWLADACGVAAGMACYFASQRVVRWLSPHPSWPSTLPIEVRTITGDAAVDSGRAPEHNWRKDAA